MDLPRLTVTLLFFVTFAVQAVKMYVLRENIVIEHVCEPITPALSVLSWVSAGSIGVFAFGLNLPEWSNILLPVGTTIIGYVFLTLGLAMWLASQRSLGRYWSRDLQLISKHRLVTSGPYRYVKHPMYIAFVIIAIGLVLVSHNLIVSIPFGLYSLLVLTRIPHEQAMMQNTLGKKPYSTV